MSTVLKQGCISVGCVLTTAVAATRCQYLGERGLLGVCLEEVCLGDGALHREGVCLERGLPRGWGLLRGGLPREEKGVCPTGGGLPRRVCLVGVYPVGEFCLERGLPRGEFA